MDERVYKTVSQSGAANLTIGVLVLAGGIAAGVMLIVSGAKLLCSRKKMLI
ncbi:MAG: hypothetical protein ACLU61_03185 [Lachnospiraceae bacterium]